MNDEWSYAFSARQLAETGHITYNGWAAPIVGWMMVLGAVFIKGFGFSYGVTRIAILFVSMGTAFLLERSLVRLGIAGWNATVGTLAVVLSPLFLPLEFSFMTDVPGLFCLVLCLYCCLRALQAGSDRPAGKLHGGSGRVGGGTASGPARCSLVPWLPSPEIT